MDSIDINWQEELRELIERKVREEYKRRLFDKGRVLRKKMRTLVSATELMRRDRDER